MTHRNGNQPRANIPAFAAALGAGLLLTSHFAPAETIAGPTTAPAQLIAQVGQLLADARKLKQIGDVRGALDQLNDLRKLDDANPEAEAIRQEIAKQLVFVRNEAERQRQADSFLQRGWEFECAGNFSAAVGSYNVALVMYTSREEVKTCANRVAHALKIQTLLETARNDEIADRLPDALVVLDELHQFDPDIAEAAQMKPRLLQRIAVEKQLMAYMATAASLESQGNLRGVLETCDLALKLDPGFAGAKSRKAVAADKISQLTAALLADVKRAQTAADYPAALKSLDALVQYGPNAEAAVLRTKILAIMKADADRREAMLISLLADAKNLADAGDPQQAIGRLDKESDNRAAALRSQLVRQMNAAESERAAGDSAMAKAQFSQALEAYRRAVSGGSVRAMVSLATLYGKGQGVGADPAEREKWLRRAADRDDGEAMESLALLLRGRDNASAVLWFQRAASAGRKSAVLPLAAMYEQGEGVPKNPVQAFGYYLQAANNDDPIAMYRVAEMYEQGTGVSKDPARALEWYQKAAKRGNRDAIDWLKRRDARAKHLLDHAQ